VINRDVEVALNLRGMKIERKGAAGAGGFKKIGDELGRYRNAGLVLAVLARVAVVRKHSGDAPGGGAFERIDHEKQFKKMIIDRKGAGLDNENIRATDIFEDLKINLAIAEAAEQGFAEGHVEVPANGFRQRGVGGPGEDFETLVVHTVLTEVISRAMTVHEMKMV
jgi:hypothetical protein